MQYAYAVNLGQTSPVGIEKKKKPTCKMFIKKEKTLYT